MQRDLPVSPWLACITRLKRSIRLSIDDLRVMDRLQYKGLVSLKAISERVPFGLLQAAQICRNHGNVPDGWLGVDPHCKNLRRGRG